MPPPKHGHLDGQVVDCLKADIAVRMRRSSAGAAAQGADPLFGEPRNRPPGALDGRAPIPVVLRRISRATSCGNTPTGSVALESASLCRTDARREPIRSYGKQRTQEASRWQQHLASL